jgi:hypothetical protein
MTYKGFWAVLIKQAGIKEEKEVQT